MRLTASRLVASAALLLLLAFPRESAALDITLQWDPNPPADAVLGYRVYVGTVPGVYTSSFQVTSGTAFTYTNANASVLYYFAVAAYNAAGEGPRSSPITSLVDHPLSTGTQIKAVHMVQLRTAIDALRMTHSLAPYTWTDPVITPGVTTIRVAHLLQLRAALADVYNRLGRPVDFGQTPISAGVTPVRSIDIMELRSALLNLGSS